MFDLIFNSKNLKPENANTQNPEFLWYKKLAVTIEFNIFQTIRDNWSLPSKFPIKIIKSKSTLDHLGNLIRFFMTLKFQGFYQKS